MGHVYIKAGFENTRIGIELLKKPNKNEFEKKKQDLFY